MLVVTVVEGKVPIPKTKEFEEAFSLGKKEMLPPGLVSSALLKNIKNPETYRVQTVWDSREALDKMRSSTETPKAFEFFQKVGVMPTLEVYEIINNIP